MRVELREVSRSVGGMGGQDCQDSEDLTKDPEAEVGGRENSE